jgi:hypothetical protein
VLALLVAAAVLPGCSKQDPGAAGQNLPPETTLSFVSDAADTTTARVHLTWLGTDHDGEVVGYLARWDSLEWFHVSATDSVFVLEGDSSDSLGEYGVHTFSVKAIDNDGEEDPTPATLTFTSRNTFPETEIVHGPGWVTHPQVCFEWRGWDYDGVVVGYGWTLFTREADEWLEVAGEDSVPADEFSLQLGPLDGEHRFEVWSIDDLGAVDPTPDAVEFRCDIAPLPPYLVVETNLIGEHTFGGASWPPLYVATYDIFEGEHLVFDWYLRDDGYNSCPTLGYSRAFDDTSDWCQSFSLEDTHFEVSPGVGEHWFYVAAMGPSGALTRGRIQINVLETGLDDYILVVDDYDHWEHVPMWGLDADRDAFYDTLTAGYVRPRVQWDPAEHIEQGVPQPPDVEALAGASTVVWYCDMDYPTLSGLFDDFFEQYDRLGAYVRAGGNLIVCGCGLLRTITSESYPMSFSEFDTAPGRVFIRDVLRIGSVRNSGAAANPDAPWNYGYCFHGAVPGGTGIPGGRVVDLEPMYIDSVGAGGYPEPGKWWPYADPPAPIYSRCGLGEIDVFEPQGGRPIETHVVDAFLNYEFDGRTCVLLSPTGTNRGNVCCMGFSLYYLQTPQVKAVFDELLPLFGEERS